MRGEAGWAKPATEQMPRIPEGAKGRIGLFQIGHKLAKKENPPLACSPPLLVRGLRALRVSNLRVFLT
jgi:hypothetical protein